jgi:hypothetical protein
MRSPRRSAPALVFVLGCAAACFNESPLMDDDGSGSGSETTRSDGSTTGESTGETTETSAITSVDTSSSTDVPGECGNGVVDAREQCDGAEVCTPECTWMIGGLEIWTEIVDGAGAINDRAYAVDIAPDGRIVVAGEVTSGGSDIDAWLRTYDPEGNQGWTVIPWSLPGEDVTRGLVVDDDGTAFVCGWLSTQMGPDRWAGAYSAAGDELWLNQYSDLAGPDRCRGLALTEAHALVAVGEGNVPSDILVSEISIASGSSVPIGSFSGTEVDPSNDGALGLLPHGDGIIVGGWVARESGQEGFIGRFALTGNLEWWYGDGTAGGAETIDVILFDGVGFHGFGASDTAGDQRAIKMYLDGAGNPTGVVFFGGETLRSIEGGAVDGAGNFVLAGRVTADTGVAAWVSKQTPDGEVLWTHVHGMDDLGDESADAVAVAPDESIVVVGYVTPGDWTDIWIRKLTP